MFHLIATVTIYFESSTDNIMKYTVIRNCIGKRDEVNRIKIDVKAAEYEALKGAHNILS